MEYIRAALLLLFAAQVAIATFDYNEVEVEGEVPLPFTDSTLNLGGKIGGETGDKFAPGFYEEDVNDVLNKGHIFDRDYDADYYVRHKPCSRICNRDTGNQGVCLPGKLCHARGGRKVGVCRKEGLFTDQHTCCKFEKTCGSETRELVTYFTSPNFPSKERDELSCSHVVTVRPGVCQVKIDFVKFELPAPNQRGICRASDRMQVLSPQNPLGVLGRGTDDFCGLNDDQHIYVPARSGDIITLTATLSGTSAVPLATTRGSLASDTSYRWELKITQIECGCGTAPDGCLQYHKDMRGSMKSFNFDGRALFRPEMSYAICVRQVRSTCSITYRSIMFGVPHGSKCCEDGSRVSGVAHPRQQCPATAAPFDEYPAPGRGRRQAESPEDGEPGAEAAAAGGAGRLVPCCSQRPDYAYVGINADTDGFRSQKRYRFCGTELGRTGTIISKMRPFRIQVESGKFDLERMENGNKYVGFHIDYEVNTGAC